MDTGGGGNVTLFCATQHGTVAQHDSQLQDILFAGTFAVLCFFINSLLQAFLCLRSCTPRCFARCSKLLNLADMKVGLHPTAQPVGTSWCCAGVKEHAGVEVCAVAAVPVCLCACVQSVTSMPT
mgnify:CR=1 FL=1